MRAALIVCGWAIFFIGGVYGGQSQQQILEQTFQEFVQLDHQIENLLKQKLQLKAEVAQHMQREEMSIRPHVDRRQEEEIEALSQQIQMLSQQIASLEEKRSAVLLKLQ